jgi:hypothetical protein
LNTTGVCCLVSNDIIADFPIETKRREVLRQSDVSEKYICSFFRVEEEQKQETNRRETGLNFQIPFSGFSLSLLFRSKHGETSWHGMQDPRKREREMHSVVFAREPKFNMPVGRLTWRLEDGVIMIFEEI